MKNVEQIRDALVELNSDIAGSTASAKAFLAEFDEDLDGHIVHVIFVTESLSVEDGLDELDALCSKANDKLDTLVAFVNCIYRSEADFKEDFIDSQWSNGIRYVESAA